MMCFCHKSHFAATVQIQQRQRTADKVKVDELDGVRELLRWHVREVALTNKVSHHNVLPPTPTPLHPHLPHCL